MLKGGEQGEESSDEGEEEESESEKPLGTQGDDEHIVVVARIRPSSVKETDPSVMEVDQGNPNQVILKSKPCVREVAASVHHR